jgi:transcriptional regulator with XRE-family HTH domain
VATVQGEEQKRIGELIRQQRKLKKMTQTELGALLNLGTKAISDYEKGHIKVIPFEKRVKLASILDIPIAELLYSDEKSTYEECELTSKKYSRIASSFHDLNDSELSVFFDMLELQPIKASQLQKEILKACNGLTLGNKILMTLKITSENKTYCDSERFISDTLFKIISEHKTKNGDVENKLNISYGDKYSLINCVKKLYMEIVKEQKGSANDKTQQ